MSSESLTREITLPISGQLAIIREGDGFSDQGIFRANKPRNEVLYEYIAAMTASIGEVKPINANRVKDLLVPDQEFLAIEIFRLNYGDAFEFDFRCNACGDKSTQAIPLDRLDMIPVPADSSGAPDPIMTIELPRSKKIAEIGMLDGHKETQIMSHRSTAGPDINRSDYAAVRTLDGSPDFTLMDIVKLLKRDHLAIRQARKKLISGYDPMVVIACPSCGNRTHLNVLAHPDFLAPGA